MYQFCSQVEFSVLLKLFCDYCSCVDTVGENIGNIKVGKNRVKQKKKQDKNKRQGQKQTITKREISCFIPEFGKHS